MFGTLVLSVEQLGHSLLFHDIFESNQICHFSISASAIHGVPVGHLDNTETIENILDYNNRLYRGKNCSSVDLLLK